MLIRIGANLIVMTEAYPLPARPGIRCTRARAIQEEVYSNAARCCARDRCDDLRPSATQAPVPQSSKTRAAQPLSALLPLAPKSKYTRAALSNPLKSAADQEAATGVCCGLHHWPDKGAILTVRSCAFSEIRNLNAGDQDRQGGSSGSFDRRHRRRRSARPAIHLKQRSPLVGVPPGLAPHRAGPHPRLTASLLPDHGSPLRPERGGRKTFLRRALPAKALSNCL
jgi:hypothetical protein